MELVFTVRVYSFSIKVLQRISAYGSSSNNSSLIFVSPIRSLSFILWVLCLIRAHFTSLFTLWTAELRSAGNVYLRSATPTTRCSFNFMLLLSIIGAKFNDSSHTLIQPSPVRTSGNPHPSPKRPHHPGNCESLQIFFKKESTSSEEKRSN